jgi:hypothetical protein
MKVKTCIASIEVHPLLKRDSRKFEQIFDREAGKFKTAKQN